MKRDMRATALYREAEALNAKFRRPGSGQIGDASEVHPSPDGKSAVFTGALVDKLEGGPLSRICGIDFMTAQIHVLTFGPNTDRCPRYSPDGRHVAFLSDRHKLGDFQLYLLDPLNGAARAAPVTDGWVEYLRWSPSGRRILLGVAGYGADLSGAQGGVGSKQIADLPSWMPLVDSADKANRWRRPWVYDLEMDTVRPIGQVNTNIWEAVWCGDDAVAAVASPGPEEGFWYTSSLNIIRLDTGETRELYRPTYQLGWPAASPSGRLVAIVEASCSDRGLVAGDLLIIDTASGHVREVHTSGTDITCTEWRSEQDLLVAGQRGFVTAVGMYDALSNSFRETWCTESMTTAGPCVSVSGIDENGDCLLVGESFTRAPEIGAVRNGEYRSLKSLDLGYGSVVAQAIGSVEPLTWCAEDGLAIQGWLLRPRGAGPHPLIVDIHGGPVWQWRPLWLGRSRAYVLMMLGRGYAVLFPNPRGSCGRGQHFARRVIGDVGGADASDCLSGIDFLVAQGIADPRRLGVTGVSYGGFMTYWLITQDSRFAAAVAVSPISNHVTSHLLSNTPQYVRLSLADEYTNPMGRYFTRSPIMFAHKARTPTLSLCGALDRCTPPEEAVQFHNALRETGIESVLLIYPQEGHGVRRWPASIDHTARLVAWFEQHMSAGDLRQNSSPTYLTDGGAQ